MSDVCFGYDPLEDTTITVEEPPVVEEPDSCLFISSNVITANNDQVNDKVSFFHYCGFPVQILIVNRWGQKVFESTNPLEEWKGQDMGGQLLEEGVYFWSVQYEDETGEVHEQHGHITLFH
jgi:gliding motility-associated-like protein